ncbi:MAG: CDP-glycerol glycerophosphotransferase family protein [Chlamydiota bacterium]|jgi:hypothetical protein
MTTVSIITNKDFHYLDHLAPLSALLKIPLIVTDEDIFHQAKTYYPDLEAIYVESHLFVQYLIEHAEKIISCLTRPYLELLFILFPQEYQKMEFVWCPHGLSDKGRNSSFFDPLLQENTLLLYGSKMKSFLKGKNLLKKQKVVEVGNYRFEYFNKHKSFYKKIIEEKLQKFSDQKPIVLYAPTWEDYEANSSLHIVFEKLLKSFPSNFNLVVKLHPNTLRKQDYRKEMLMLQFEDKPNIMFLHDFPCIYPLIDYVDRYLGDFSSIGYDFLTYQKPMYFLTDKTKSDAPLFSCGEIFHDINSEALKNIFHSDPKIDTVIRKDLYRNCFNQEENWKQKI